MRERFTARLRAKLRARVKMRQDVVSMCTVEKRIAYEERRSISMKLEVAHYPFPSIVLSLPPVTISLYCCASPQPTHPRAIPRSKYAQDLKATESTPSVREPISTENAM